MINLIVVIILLILVGGAVFYIVKAKRNGAACIGCSAGCSRCAGKKMPKKPGSDGACSCKSKSGQES